LRKELVEVEVMGDVGKRIVVSVHAAQRMLQRGATREEVERVIREEAWRPAQRGKWSAAHRFPFDAISPVNGKRYAYKKVETVFADKPTAIVVVTVKVYYHD
jgi:hypothetical protein